MDESKVETLRLFSVVVGGAEEQGMQRGGQGASKDEG